MRLNVFKTGKELNEYHALNIARSIKLGNFKKSFADA